MESQKIVIDGKTYKVIGKGIYSSRKNPEGKQIKIFLEDHKTLMIIPDSKTFYFGIDKGELADFNDFPEKVIYKGKEMKMVNHDYQLEDKIEFGWTEGECEFWDYEGDDKNTFISIAILTCSKKRSDVELKLIDVNRINGLKL